MNPAHREDIALAVAAIMIHLGVKELTLPFSVLQRASESKVTVYLDQLTRDWRLTVEPKPKTLEGVQPELRVQR